MWTGYPSWLNPGDNAWQLTAATLVGLMSVPGLVVLYGGVMQKRWSVNSMMMSFIAFALVLIAWVLVGFEMAFGHPLHIFGAHHGFFANMIGIPRDILGHVGEQGQASIPLITTGPPFHFPTSTLAYFQFVFAAITPILMLGSVLGRINFKAWIPFVILGSSIIYPVNAFLIWGGGWWAQRCAVDSSGGRLRERLGRDRDRGHRLHDRVHGAQLPEPAASVPPRGRHAGGGLHARLRRAGRRPAHRVLRRPEDDRVPGNREDRADLGGR